MFDESGARAIDHIEHQVESVGTAVVRIGDIEVVIRCWIELSEKDKRVTSGPFRVQLAQISKVASIHREDVVELGKIFGLYPPSPSAERDPVPLSDFGGAGVGRLSHMPGASTRRVDPHAVGEIGLLQAVRKNSLAEGRTTDVT